MEIFPLNGLLSEIIYGNDMQDLMLNYLNYISR